MGFQMSHPRFCTLFDSQHPHWTHALQTLLDASCAMFAWFFSYSCSHRCCIWTWKNVLTIRVWCVQYPSIALDETKHTSFAFACNRTVPERLVYNLRTRPRSHLCWIWGWTKSFPAAWMQFVLSRKILEELSGGITLCQWRSPSIFTCKNLMKTPRLMRLLVQIVPSN